MIFFPAKWDRLYPQLLPCEQTLWDLLLFQHHPLQRQGEREAYPCFLWARMLQRRADIQAAGGNLQSEHEPLLQPRQMSSALCCFRLSLGVGVCTQICSDQSPLPLKASAEGVL